MSEKEKTPQSLKQFVSRAVAAAQESLAAHVRRAARAGSAARAAWSGKGIAATAEHDETIRRLELEISAERDHVERLNRTVKELQFKLEVMERSYSKQLTDARSHGDALGEELSAVQTQLAATKDELAEVAATRDRLRAMFAFNGRRTPPEMSPNTHPDNTINRLLSDDGWSEAEERSGGRYLEDKIRSAQEAPPEELLAPELVLKLDEK